MKKIAVLIFIGIVLASLTGCREDEGTIKKESIVMEAMELNDFYKQLKDKGLEKQSFEIEFTGDTEKSPDSGKEFYYLEAVLFYGQGEEIGSTYQILYHSECDLQFVSGSTLVNIYWRKIRPYVDDVYAKECTKDNYMEYMENYKWAFEEEGAERAKFVETGLIKGKKYNAMFDLEEYHLPPREKNGKPEKKTNLVLMISDKPFMDGKPQGELTPLFSGWTY